MFGIIKRLFRHRSGPLERLWTNLVTRATNGAAKQFEAECSPENRAGTERQAALIGDYTKQPKPCLPDIPLSIPQDRAAMMANCRHSDIMWGIKVTPTEGGGMIGEHAPYYICLETKIDFYGHKMHPLCKLMFPRGQCGMREICRSPLHELVNNYTT